MVFHPPGIVVEIVGTEADDQGCLCEEHTLNCSKVLEPEVVVRLWKVQVMVEGREEKAIAVVWVNDGINCLPCGFFPRHMVKHAEHCDRALAQVTCVCSSDAGFCDSAEWWMYPP